MTEDDKGKLSYSLPGQPRRSSPRYSLRRQVFLKCRQWPDFEEVFTENIGTHSLLVFITGEPPEVDEEVLLRIPDAEGEPRELGGCVVRVETDPSEGGRTGVAIRIGGSAPQPMVGLINDPAQRPSAQSVAASRRGRVGGSPQRAEPPKPLERPPSQGRPPGPPIPPRPGAPRPPPPPPPPGALKMPRPPTGPNPPLPRTAIPAEEGAESDCRLAPGAERTPLSDRLEVDLDDDLDLSDEGGSRSEGVRASDPIELDLDDLSEELEADRGSEPPGVDEAEESGARAAGAVQERTTPVGEGPPTPRPSPRPAVEALRPSALPEDQQSLRQINVRTRHQFRPAPAVIGRAEAPMVGIDFGTTYSKVAVVTDGEVVLVEDTTSQSSARTAVPSTVAYFPDGKSVVGDNARELLATDPSQVIGSVKRVMGLTYSDPLANGLLGSLACTSHPGPNDSILFGFHGCQYTVPQVVQRILEHLRDMASKWLSAKVKKAVFTVPVEFDIRSKREIELAARMAGIEIMGMIPEPVAAAMGCGHDGKGEATVAVYDFGGGTFDASIVQVGQHRFSVRGAAGDRWLGGDDFDETIARYVADEFQKNTGLSLHNRAEEWQRLLFASEEAKRWLSTLETVDVVLPRAANTPKGPLTLLVPMTRQIFQEITDDILTSSLEVCRTATRRARVNPRDVTVLLVTGGTTRIPAVRMAAERFFGQRGVAGIHPEHAVVIGAAVRAAVLSKMKLPEDFIERLRGLGTVGRTIGLALAGGVTEHIIEASQRPPTAAHRLYSTSRDNQTTIRLELVQGPSRVTAENERVGGFVIEGLPPCKAGIISLDVFFELSTTGTLYVTAQERTSGQRAQGTFNLNVG